MKLSPPTGIGPLCAVLLAVVALLLALAVIPVDKTTVALVALLAALSRLA